MIDLIYFDKNTLKGFEFEEELQAIDKLGILNVFVGSNNSGKSRFIRYLFSKEDTSIFYENSMKWNDFNRDFFKEFKDQYESIWQFSTNGLLLKRHDDIDHLCNTVQSTESIDFYNIIEVVNYLVNATETDIFESDIYNEHYIPSAVKKYNQLGREFELILRRVNFRSPNRNYIPILRGLRPIHAISDVNFSNNDNYTTRTKFDYYYNREDVASNNLNIHSGLTMYEDVRKLLLGDEGDRNEIKEFEMFLAESIFSEKVTLIPKHNEDVLNIKLGNQKQLPVFNLGDGLQTIITILFPVFRARKRSACFFIEEPESHLHPRWQMLLLKALKSFNKTQFFITTHSAVFINDEDSVVFSVKNKTNKSLVSRLHIENRKSKILAELGYQPSDFLITNYIIWVEGPSDKIYLNYFLSNSRVAFPKLGQC